MIEFECHGGLIIDEMKLAENFTVKGGSGRIHGFVDLGPFTPEPEKTVACDHSLVILFQPLSGSWHQILGVFASRGNVKAPLLSKIILEATLLAENAGLRVDYVTCGDFPHLVKCIWNGFVKTGYKTPHGHVDVMPIKIAHELDKCATTLKFSGYNDHPTSAQFLTTVNCLAFYNLVKAPHSGNTAGGTLVSLVGPNEVANEVDNLIDAGKLEDASSVLDASTELTDRIYPQQTSDATLVYYLAGYVGRRKRFFGIVRSFKGDEDHPSITQFSQIYRLLLLYTPLKAAVKGNCSGPCDSVLVSLQDSLGSKAKAAAELKATVESKLHKKLECISSFPDENDTQDSSNGTVQDMVVYYLCGYVHRKMEKVTMCKDCLASLTSTPEEYASARTTRNGTHSDEILQRRLPTSSFKKPVFYSQGY
ncbi:hypothetical protein HPB50_014150 [Hyalomma asiaticum]|uniref:Uncharacterized protein n=1 Tax=Hyalomma asiaticum TaxID=266040 RepID=A0ACB7SEM4_HYAAI|nr:hypothetical protein HPB50_014150 [Hyalomma asiaticum]